jgi:hypothetical protein
MKEQQVSMNQGIANAVRGSSRLAETSKAMIHGWRRQMCDCGHASILPKCHDETCKYRKFWEDATRAAQNGS